MINKKKICFISHFPPPIHGLSKAVDTLYNSYLSNIFDFEKIDISNNRMFLRNLVYVFNSKADLFYFTISQSKLGNIRDLIILNLLNIRKKKCLVHLHGGYYRKLIENDVMTWQKKMNYIAMSKVKGAIVLSESLRYHFEGIVSKDKIHIIPNCVDENYLISDQEFSLKMDELQKSQIKQVLYLSNFIRSKGYDKVLEMAKLEKENHLLTGKRKFHFNFAGSFFDEQEEKFFQEFIYKYNLEDYITYHGIVSGESKRQLLEDNHIFMLPTRYPNEGQPISILEAMGNGMFIVTTDHAGIPDIVKDNVNGILMLNDNIPLVYDKLNEASFIKTANTNRDKVMNFYREFIYLKNIEYYFNSI